MTGLPFAPIRNDVYSASELLQGFDASNPSSSECTVDLRIYRFFVKEGRGAAQSPYTSMMEALHDHYIDRTTQDLLASYGRVIGVMGGHEMSRSEASYRQVAELAGVLARNKALVVSGGGPGAMEAAHLGAALAFGSPTDLNSAINLLCTQAKLPAGLDKMVSPTGDFNPSLRDAFHQWWSPAVHIARELAASATESLGLPTWYYGHEPFTPLATRVGKYFQNSLREDGLVSFCGGGVVFTQGRAGTLQEIFQDAAKNYYRSVGNRFSPMVFLGTDYWKTKLPAVPLLTALFTPQDFTKYICITDSATEATDFLLSFPIA